MAGARILVVGGSLGGLMAANVLHRAGWRVTLLEKAAGSLDGRGAGIVTHARLVSALRAAGVAVDDSLGVRVTTRVALGPDGEPEARCDYDQVLTSWSRLYTLLSAALPAPCLQAGHTVQAVEQDAHGVCVRCDGGRSFEGDLLVASDGIRSTVRSQLAADVRVEYAGYVAWRGVTDEAALSAHTRATLFEHFGFGLPPGEQIIGYPVAGPGNSTAPGQRRYNFVWYRAADEAHELPRLLTDADGIVHAQGIPPHKVHAREVAGMRAAAHALLAPQWAEVLDRCEQPFLQPIHDLQSERIAFGRVALMGDAAFVARPHVGMGVTKAGEDALALADGLARHGATPPALQAYETQRLAPGRAIVERGRRLGAYLQARAHGRAAQRRALDVLNQTAIDLARGSPPHPHDVNRAAVAHP
jgi:2-polyprenyl-6-methoxyphenol hydroxylase-like FAD-dependent oxidoreductase